MKHIIHLHFLSPWTCADCDYVIFIWWRHKPWLRFSSQTQWLNVHQWFNCVCFWAQAVLKRAMKAPYWRSSLKTRSAVSRGSKRMLYMASCLDTLGWWSEMESYFSKWPTCWPALIHPTSWTARWEWGTVNQVYISFFSKRNHGDSFIFSCLFVEFLCTSFLYDLSDTRGKNYIWLIISYYFYTFNEFLCSYQCF